MLVQGEFERFCLMSIATVTCMRRWAVNKHLVNKALFSQKLAEFTVLCIIPIQPDSADFPHRGNQQEADFLVWWALPWLAQGFRTLPTAAPPYTLIAHYVTFHVAAKHSHLSQKVLQLCQDCLAEVVDQASR